MSAKRFYGAWRLIKHLNVWYLLAAAIILTATSALALRQNNQTSIKLRNHVYQVDKDDGDIETALNQLRVHIYSHMFSGLSSPGGAYPPIQLKYRYERLVAAQKAKTGQSSSQIYTEAQGYCEQRFPIGLSGSGRIPCIENYVASHKAADAPTIPDALYKFDFAAPLWSPDLAGITMVLAAVCWLLLFARWVAIRYLSHRLD
jgi:hypothetical protein